MIFPEEIAHLLRDNFTSTVPKTVKGLGMRSAMVNSPTVSVTAFLKSDSDMASYLGWWIYTVDYGTLPFTIELPLLGVTKEWNVSITKDATDEIRSGETRMLKLELTILDDLDDLTRDDLLGASTIIYTMDDVSTDGIGNRYLENEA